MRASIRMNIISKMQSTFSPWSHVSNVSRGRREEGGGLSHLLLEQTGNTLALASGHHHGESFLITIDLRLESECRVSEPYLIQAMQS